MFEDAEEIETQRRLGHRDTETRRDKNSKAQIAEHGE